MFALDVGDFKIAKTEISKDLFHDLGNGLVLEYPTVGRAGQKPEPRHHFGAVVPPALIALVAGIKPVHKAVEKTS